MGVAYGQHCRKQSITWGTSVVGRAQWKWNTEDDRASGITNSGDWQAGVRSSLRILVFNLKICKKLLKGCKQDIAMIKCVF